MPIRPGERNVADADNCAVAAEGSRV